MKPRVGLDLLGYKHKLERAMGHDVSIAEIARGAGLGEAGLYKSFRGEYGGVQFETLEKLLAFAWEQGAEMRIGELFAVEVSD